MKTHSLPINLVGSLFLAAILFTSFSTEAQESLVVEWETIHSNDNGSREMELNSIKARNDMAYVAGYRSTVDGERMYAAAYQSNGTLEWEITLASAYSSDLDHLVLDGDGNIYVAGSESVGSPGEPPIHLAAIAPNGSLIWHTTFDAIDGTDVELIWVELYDDKLLLVGTEEGENGYDIAWASEFNLDGDMQWKTSFDPGNGTVFTDISMNNQGELVACGWADYGYSHLLVAFDSEGNIEWSYPEDLNGNNEAWLNDLTSDADGNWIAIGSEETDGLFEYDAVTLKIDTNGNEIWSERYNNGYENYGSLVRVASDGSIRSIINTEDDFDYFVRTISYDSNGNELWATNYDIEAGTDVVAAEINGNNELFLGVRDYDFYGFAKLSPGGEIESSIDYDESVANNLRDIALDDENIYGCAYLGTSEQSLILALEQDQLQELSSTIATGDAMSDVYVGDLVSDGNHVWMANFSDAGDSTVMSITKFDYSGNTLWTKDKHYSALSPRFDILEHDNSGNIIGFYENLISGGVTNLGLVKYDADGNEIFTVAYDSSATLYDGSITTDPNDNIYVGGYNQNSKLMFLSMLDPVGNEVWTTHYESPSPTFPYAIPLMMKYSAQDKLVLAGVYKNADNVNNLHLFHYDNNGNLEWEEEVNPLDGNLVSVLGLEVDADGDITVFGSSTVGTYVVASYDISGNMNWSEALSLPSGHAPRSMAMDDDGNTYLCFSTPSSAVFRKLDNSGNLVENVSHTIPGYDSFHFPRACSVVDDKLVVLGDYLGTSDNLPLEMLLDSDLNLLYGNVDIASPGFFAGFDTDAAGFIHGTFILGNNFGGPGYRVGLVRQYGILIVGIEEEEWDERFVVYPNPAETHLNLYLKSNQNHLTRIELLDVNGNLVESYGEDVLITGKSTMALQLPDNISKGLYILRIVNDGKIFNYRIIKQ